MGERDTIEQMLQQDPLIAFSVYTAIQVHTLNVLAREIFELLDSSMTAGSVDGQGFNRAYGMFWLWVLGAYEVTRTMCQAKSCFSPKLATKLHELKNRLSKLRIPFAKQEYAGSHSGTGTPIKGEASIYGLDTSRKDLTFEVKGTVLSVRDLVGAFESIFRSIKRQDILQDHRRSYDGAS